MNDYRLIGIPLVKCKCGEIELKWTQSQCPKCLTILGRTSFYKAIY